MSLPIRLFLPLLLLVGCGQPDDSKFNPASYDKIHNGMSLAEVEAILGPAGDDTTEPLLVEAQKRAKVAESVKWKKWPRPGDKERFIAVAFDEGKVVTKAKRGM